MFEDHYGHRRRMNCIGPMRPDLPLLIVLRQVPSSVPMSMERNVRLPLEFFQQVEAPYCHRNFATIQLIMVMDILQPFCLFRNKNPAGMKDK